ncbi:MAG: hypothetical protein U0166_03665 [Acidobacteriota bacterium]
MSNMAQAHAYEAFFEVFWKASWVSASTGSGTPTAPASARSATSPPRASPPWT